MEDKQIFEHILIGVDGSIPSDVAQELTTFVAKKFKSKVTAINIVAHELMHPQLQRFSPETPEIVGAGARPQAMPWVRVDLPKSTPLSNELTVWGHQKGEEVISEALELFRSEGIAADHKLIEHVDPAEAITKETETGNYDLVVVGHGGKEKQALRLGSVAKKVAHYAKIPVLLAGKKTEVTKILVPTDGSENSEKALRYAVQLAKKFEATMTLLHVQESHLFRMKPQASKEIGTRILSKTAEQAKGVQVDQKLEAGHPGDLIVETAKDQNYDLIVMGTKGLGAITRFLLGSVSDHVIHHADCAVLLTR